MMGCSAHASAGCGVGGPDPPTFDSLLGQILRGGVQTPQDLLVGAMGGVLDPPADGSKWGPPPRSSWSLIKPLRLGMKSGVGSTWISEKCFQF